MNIRNLAVLASILILSLLSACSDNDDNNSSVEPAEPLKILTIGGSRVAGDHPTYESYRYELWKNLITENWNVDFVGYLEDAATYPEYMGQTFDPDHAGIAGLMTPNVINNIQDILSEETDVVLMDIGGNDLLNGTSPEETVAKVNEIIDLIQEKYPNVTVIVEQIAPAHSFVMSAGFTPLMLEFNELILEVAEQQTNETSKVIVVDMAEGWSDAYLADELHYNETGAKIIADRYFEAIEAFVEKR